MKAAGEFVDIHWFRSFSLFFFKNLHGQRFFFFSEVEVLLLAFLVRLLFDAEYDGMVFWMIDSFFGVTPKSK